MKFWKEFFWIFEKLEIIEPLTAKTLGHFPGMICPWAGNLTAKFWKMSNPHPMPCLLPIPCPLNIMILFGCISNDRGTHAGHPITVFCKISARRSKYCLEFSIAWIRLKNPTWPFPSCTVFEAYLINSLRFCEVWIFTFHTQGQAILIFVGKKKPKIFRFKKCDGEMNKKTFHFHNALNSI